MARRNPGMWRSTALLLATTALHAYAWSEPVLAQGELVTVRDSAGVVLLEVQWQALLADAAVDPPALEVHVSFGEAEGTGILLDGVVGAVPVMEGGRWVIGQSRAPFLLLVEGERIIAAAGRTGEGPGEFRRLDWIGGLAGGPILVYSGLDHRISRFGPDLSFVDMTRLDSEEFTRRGFNQAVTVRGITTEGTLIAQATRLRPGSGLVPEGWSRAEAGLLAIEDQREVGAILATVSADEVHGTHTTCPPEGARCAVFTTTHPLRKRTITRVHGSALYVLDSATGTVEVRDPSDGLAQRVVFRAAFPEPTPDMVDRVMEERRRTTALRPELERNLRRVTSPGPPPTLRDFVVDGHGHIWFQFDPFVVPEAEGLLVRLEPDQRTVGLYRARPGLVLLGADQRFVWGVTRDELGVEYLKVFRLP